MELDTISYSCDCDKIEHNKIKISSLDMNEYKSEISYIEDELLCKNIRDNKLCKNKFSYFHIKSNENICQTCYEGDNTKELNRFDSISIFSNLNYLINFIIDEKNISNINNEKIDSKTKEKKLENYAKLKHLIITTIVNYILYPNYNLYVTQKNLFEAFIEYTENINIQNDCDYYKKQIEINRNKKKLVNLNPKLNNYVIKVDVRQLKFYEKSIEKYIIGKFENLIELNLSENCLYSMEPLTKAIWKKLKTLIMRYNKLDDKNIIHLKNLNAKELKSLNLEINNFTKYELFLAIGNNKQGSFKKLEKLQIGLNNFRPKMKKNNKKEGKCLEEIVNELNKLDFSMIKILGVNNGVFSQKTVEKILPALKLKTWKNVDLRFNDLTNLNFANNMDFDEKLVYEGNFIKKN